MPAPSFPPGSLTTKEANFVDAYVKEQNGTQAALQSYPAANNNSAAVTAHRVLRRSKVRQAIRRALKGANLKLIDSMIVLKDAHSAESITSAGEGQTITQPDHRTRIKAAETHLKLRGAFPDQKNAAIKLADKRQLHQHLHVTGLKGRAVLQEAPIEVKRLALSLGRPPTEQEIEQMTGSVKPQE